MIPASVSVTISRPEPNRNPFKVGDKIRVSKNSRSMFRARIKPHEMVARMRGKKFKPTFIVCATKSDIPEQFGATLKPYNF